MDEVTARSTARSDFNTLLMNIFGGAALLLAAIGMYGLMAYSVQQRTPEMGIRQALGADSRSVRNMVVFEGMRLALIGIFIGSAGAFILARLMTGFLFGVTPWDPIVFATVPLLVSSWPRYSPCGFPRGVRLISIPPRRFATPDKLPARSHRVHNESFRRRSQEMERVAGNQCQLWLRGIRQDARIVRRDHFIRFHAVLV